MALITESIVVRLRDPATGETKTRTIPVGEPWPFDDCEKGSKAAKAQGKVKGASESKGAGEGKGASKGKGPKKPKAPRRDLRDPAVKDALTEEIMAAIEGGAHRTAEIAAKVRVDPIQVVAVLKELVDDGELVQEGRGKKARYTFRDVDAPTPDPEPAPSPEVLPTEQPPVRLRWTKETIRRRETEAARFDGGAFRIVPLFGGSHALFYEKGENEVHEYGCGEPKALKARAKEIAAAGLPSPEAYRAAGGDISQCQPRRLRLDDIELTWRETVENGRQVCVAATGDGEFKMLRTHGGSFLLVFVREGDDGIERLGCGSRDELESRALDILGQAEGGEPANQAPPPEPIEPPSPVADAAEEGGASNDGAMMSDFKEALFSHIESQDDED